MIFLEIIGKIQQKIRAKGCNEVLVKVRGPQCMCIKGGGGGM